MGKQKIDIEYPLATKSPAIIWEQISSAHGLERWFAYMGRALDRTRH